MDSWGWAIVLAAVTAFSAMLLMALYDEISRRKWLAKSGAERLSTSRSTPHEKIRLSVRVPVRLAVNSTGGLDMLGVSVDAAARRPRSHQARCPFCPFVSTIDISDVDPSAVSAVVHARCEKCARRFSFRNPKYGGLREVDACSGCSVAPAAPTAQTSPVRTDPPPVTRPPPKGVGAAGDFAGDVAARAREAIRPSTLEVPDDMQASPTSAAVLVGGARHSGGDGGGGGGDEDRPRQKPKQKPRRPSGSPEPRRSGGSLEERQSLGDGGAGGDGADAAACACAVPAARERLPQVDLPPPPFLPPPLLPQPTRSLR